MTSVVQAVILCGCMVAFASGCGSMGPKTLRRDQYEYNLAITKAQNEQMLLNLVQIRYGESPMFLRVASIVNSYSLEEELSALGYFSSGLLGDYQTVSPSLRYTDRPTITYTPLSGEKFAKSLLVPIADEVILSFIDFGWSADWVLRMCVSSINDIDNTDVFTAEGVRVQSDERFAPLVRAFQRLQDAKALRIRVEQVEGAAIQFISFENKKADPDVEADIARVKDLLDLKSDVSEYRVGRSPERGPDAEIVVRGRSLYQLMEVISAEIDVPQEDVDRQRVLPTPEFKVGGEGETGPLIRIHSFAEKPSNALVSVRHRDTWFWVDDSDYPSKKLFSIVIGLFTITESGTRDFAPVLTIPAG